MYLESRGRAGICFWARTVFIPSQIIWALSGSDTRRISWDTRNTSLISTNHLTWTNPNNRDSFSIRIQIWFSVKKRFCSINISHPLSKKNSDFCPFVRNKREIKGNMVKYKSFEVPRQSWRGNTIFASKNFLKSTKDNRKFFKISYKNVSSQRNRKAQ